MSRQEQRFRYEKKDHIILLNVKNERILYKVLVPIEKIKKNHDIKFKKENL